MSISLPESSRIARLWDIQLLKRHIENRILQNAKVFIRIENVRNVRDTARQCGANNIENQCQKFENTNSTVVARISPVPEAARECELGEIREIRGELNRRGATTSWLGFTTKFPKFW